MVKRFSNFVNEQKTESGYSETEKDDVGNVIKDKSGNPVYYNRERNPFFWELEKDLDEYKSFQPKLLDKLKTPGGGHHKSISFGRSMGSNFDSQFLIIRLMSIEPVLTLFSTTPKGIKEEGETLGQKEENEIKKILTDNGLKKVNMEILPDGVAKIEGQYDNYGQLSKVLKILFDQFGHTIYGSNDGKPLKSKPITKQPLAKKFQ